ncbi:MAG: hypothetical protein H6739_18040 [Alphaproteobacteria bacterium]|nr:hypothetical protein [Alphaproteobacteria bacterium]
MTSNLSALLDAPPSLDAARSLFAALDALPEETCAQHMPDVRRYLASPADSELRCAALAAEAWSVASLHDPETESLFPHLAPQLAGTPRPFRPLSFGLEVRLLFLKVGSPWVMENLALSPAFSTWLRLAQGRSWRLQEDDPYSLSLYGHGAVLASTKHQCELFRWKRQRDPVEGPPTEAPPSDEFDAVRAFLSSLAPRSASDRGTGAWLEIGDWSDKHTIELCCHQKGDWDVVLDYHDGHPWLNGHGWGDLEEESFLAYLRELAALE